MTTIYQIDPSGEPTGDASEIPEEGGCPIGWTRFAPPEVPEGQRAVWTGDQGWQLYERVIPSVVEPSLDETLSGIEATYEKKFDQLRRDISTAMLTDGPNMETTISSLRVRWVDTWGEYSAAIEAALEV